MRWHTAGQKCDRSKERGQAPKTEVSQMSEHAVRGKSKGSKEQGEDVREG